MPLYYYRTYQYFSIIAYLAFPQKMPRRPSGLRGIFVHEKGNLLEVDLSTVTSY